MNDADYEWFCKEFKPAVVDVLMALNEDDQTDGVPVDELALAVKAKYPKVEFMSILDAIERLMRSKSIERQGYDCKISVLDALAAFGK